VDLLPGNAMLGYRAVGKTRKRSRKSAGLNAFEGFPDNFSFSGSRFADTFLGVSVGRTRRNNRGTAPNVDEAKKVCPNPGFY